MKPKINLLPTFFSRGNFRAYLMMILIVPGLSSCFQKYYQTNTTAKVETKTLEQLKAENKYFIIHAQSIAYGIKNVQVSDGMISGTKDSLQTVYSKYLDPEVNKANHFPKKDKKEVLREVHLYTNTSLEAGNDIKLPADQIYRMDVYGLDSAAIRRSRVVGVVVIAACAALVVVVSAAAVNSLGSMQIPLDFH